ncbi:MULTISPECIES: TetR/AcrR family transcriptional regulator [Clostridium]|uniref:TetR/AcrR family transcriptional regulator n=1 Tax=Clostridium cibarium TaxID=2762247 RepID=A0ABR8PVH5_9CLOT|nr:MULTISPECIES: TetR/AcrR family transcriptional regulator [Clostridium]MBD7912166.1 TetR/AcrR family transcriptional regulator [Clostridium cibarium]
MNGKSDKTKNLLKNALVKLISKKDFEKITVKDLTDELDINRGTFYLHFKDKYDLLEQKENEVLEELNNILNNVLKELHYDFILPSKKEVLIHIFTSVYTYVEKNSDFMKVILGPNGDLNFQMKIRTFIENSLIQNLSISHDAEKMPIKYIAPFASSAQLGIIQKWIKSGMKETPEELAQLVSNIIFTLYNGVFKDIIT